MKTEKTLSSQKTKRRVERPVNQIKDQKEETENLQLYNKISSSGVEKSEI